MKSKAPSTSSGNGDEVSEGLASSMAEAGNGDGGVGQNEGATDGTASTARGTSLVRYASTRLKGSLVEGVKNVAPASSVGAVVLMVPLAAVIIGIRYRHYQAYGEDGNFTDEYDAAPSSYSSYSSYAASSYSSSYSSYSSYSAYGSEGESTSEQFCKDLEDGGGGAHRQLAAAAGGDDSGCIQVKTVFTLAESIDSKETATVFIVLIGATMVLEILIEGLNEICEKNGHVYMHLARSLYQELMMLGILSFVILLLNAEGFFDDKLALFHEIEYAHIVIFYLGVGLIFQALALAIVNKALKQSWKFGCEQTVPEMRREIESLCRGSKNGSGNGSQDSKSWWGQWRAKHGLHDTKLHLDIHLVRIAFLKVMNLPSNFAYNEYVNHCLDSATCSIANNNAATWFLLLLLIQYFVWAYQSRWPLGTSEEAFRLYLTFGAALIAMNFLLVAIIYVVKSALITKLGGSSNMSTCVELVAQKWPKADDAQTYSLKEIHERMVEAKKHGHGGGKGGRGVHGNKGGGVKGEGQQASSMASVAASMNVANVLKAKAAQKNSASGSGAKNGASNAPPKPPPLAAAKLSQAAARLAALEKPSNVPGRALPFRPPPAPAAAAAASKPDLKKSASSSSSLNSNNKKSGSGKTNATSSSSSSSSATSTAASKTSKLTVDTNNLHEAKEEKAKDEDSKTPATPTSPSSPHAKQHRGSVRTQNIVDELGMDPADVARFQKFYLLWLRTTNVFQAFYIALIFAHWAWYAPSHWEAVAMVLPLVVVYLIFTPLLVRSYALVMGLGKPDPRAMSETIEYMEHNEQALSQVAEQLTLVMKEGETLDDVFEEWDSSGDGELSFEELSQAMQDHGLHMPQSRIKAMWRKVDIDSSGSISSDEFRRALDPYLAVVRRENEEKAKLMVADGG